MSGRVATTCRPLPVRATAALVALLAVIAVALAAAPAHAHARLIASDPAIDATVDAVPSEVVLRFNEAVSSDFAAVQVTAPSGERLDAETPVVEGDHVRTPLLPVTEAGAHEVAYRVVSSDGHPIEGSFGFTVSDAAIAPPPPPEPADPPAAAPAEPEAAEPPAGPEPTDAPATDAPAAAAPPTEAAPDPTEAAPTEAPTETATELAAARGDSSGISPALLVGVVAVLVLLAGVAVAVTRRSGRDAGSPSEPGPSTG